MLREILDATDLSGPTIPKTAHGLPFSEKSLKQGAWQIGPAPRGFPRLHDP